MKRFLWITLCLCVTLTTLAQKQKGLVRTIERPGQKSAGISGVTVKINEYPNVLVSGKGGKFTFSIPGKKPGDRCQVTRVEKKGYTLAEDKLPSFAYSFNTPAEIVMVSNKQVQQEEKRIRDNATKKAEQIFNQKKSDLERQLQEKTISEDKWRVLYQQALKDRDKFRKLIDEMARRYAMTDYKGISDINRQIQECIENAELERADSLINSKGDLSQRKRDILQLQEENDTLAEYLRKRQEDAEFKKNDLAKDYFDKHIICTARYDIDSAAYYLEERAALDTTNAEWQNHAGKYAYEYLADYNLALRYYNCGLNQAIKQSGEQSEEAALLYNNIGAVYMAQGDFAKGLEYVQKSLSIREQVYGYDHPNVAHSYNNIGEVYRRLNDNNKALEYQQKALSIREKYFGTNHREVADSYNNIGGIYMMQGDLDKGLEFFQKALTIQEQYYDTNHPVVARTYDNIGQIYEKKRELDMALEYSQKALTKREQFFGTNHPDVAKSYNNIGAILTYKGNYVKGLECFQKALSIRERFYGTSHPEVASSYNNLGGIYFGLGDYSKALDYCNKLLAMPEEYLGPNLQYVKDNSEHCQYQLAYQQAFANGDYAQALEYCNKLLAMQRQYSNAPSIRTNFYICKYHLAIESGKTQDFFNVHCFTETIVDGDTPARQQGMSGEYVLLEMGDWKDYCETSLYDTNNALSGKPKDIVVLKNGVITKHHFENMIGAKLGIKQITKEERARINRLYEQWKIEHND